MGDGFFTQVDAMGIVEQHIREVLKLEDSQAKQILSSYSEVRNDLVSRLSKARSGTFTAQHLRGVLGQVEGAILAINKKLQGNMVQGAYESALKGVDHLLKELSVFDSEFTGAVTRINLRAAMVAKDTSQLLVTRYETNLDSYGRDLLRQISNGLFSATLGETSYHEVVGRIATFFDQEPWKLHRIIRTELHGIYNRGKIDGMNALVENDDMPDLRKTLMHPMDERTGMDSKLAASLRLVADLDKPFSYVWKGKRREFMTPPDRPNDRSIMVPYRTAWGKLKGSAFIPGEFPQG